RRRRPSFTSRTRCPTSSMCPSSSHVLACIDRSIVVRSCRHRRPRVCSSRRRRPGSSRPIRRQGFSRLLRPQHDASGSESRPTGAASDRRTLAFEASMFRRSLKMKRRFAVAGSALVAVTLIAGPSATRTLAQSKAGKPAPAQKLDDEYTKIIRQNLQDPRITTELVDHLPASDSVPSPLKFFGRAVGTPGELTYAKDIHRYYETLAKASPRARFWK